MLSSLGTPRPLPPAKMRKANAMRKISSSPPPAYGSPFTFPARRQMRQDILGSPMAKTFQMVGWDIPNEEPDEMEPNDIAWINEKSREELKELLVKADVLIKERENELGITSAVCKGLFQSNVALKSRHEALLARIPTSPARSNSSPSNLNQQSLPPEEYVDGHITSSCSESALDRSRSPSPELSRRHARKVSIAAADVSLLSDQNAELMEKLERLEKDATSSDQAGRRELKRLEKEITFLREALEKTQTRSDELEEKVQGAVASQAWRRKKEREAKFRAMRNIGRGPISDNSSNVPSFAPQGSTFGGPSETFSFFPGASSPDINSLELNDFDADIQPDSRTSLKPHEHALITQLLVKVQELEEANAKILQKQNETAEQLSAVQRDTAHMSRVYECLSDPESVELELAEAQGWEEEEGNAFDEKDSAYSQTVRFRSLKGTLASEAQSLRGTCVVHPDFTTTGKTRKTVMGLFDMQSPIPQQVELDHSSEENIPSDSSPWTEGHGNYSSWSSDITGGVDGTTSNRLSPLHFFSPPSQILAELSPLAGRPTLHAELTQGSNGSWNEAQDRTGQRSNRHLRNSSLYDLGHISVPPSPSPSSRSLSRRNSDQLDYDVMQIALAKSGSNTDERTPRDGSFLMPANTLQLSVEPPTPERHHANQFRTRESTGRSSSPMPKSPLIKLTSDVFRARPNRWVARRLRSRSIERRRVNFGGLDIEGYSDRELVTDTAESSPIPPTSALAIPTRLMNAVDSMIGGFDSALSGHTSTPTRGVYYLDGDASDDGQDYSSVPVTPRTHGDERRLRPRRRSAAGGRGIYDREIHAFIDAEPPETEELQVLTNSSAASTPQKSGTARDEHQSFLVKVWLWIQFAIVVFVFLYAMARRGPKTMLADENRRAVARRR